ncbi:MAG: sn-glycerol-1-phosphate dehydrogenase [Chloroflexi bacterium]|nr:sn-glycerol-1-phosphate dehydrogenase [Chloroflexota bacterium]
MTNAIPVYIGRNAIQELVNYCRANGLERFTLVTDQNTYAALGASVERALRDTHFDVATIVLEGAEVVADAHYLVQVLVHTDQQNRTFLAVGSGTITDITRFVSHRTKSSFISLPTAPSVDGFTSVGAPLVIGGLKQTIICQPPIAVFGDLATLCAAPHRLIASGFGDMIGKLLSIADWKLGHVLWDERYDEQILQRSRQAALNVGNHAAAIGQADEASVSLLLEGLIESGFCILEFGNSNPASGAEHHLSHFWEMQLLWQNKPAILHGEKVGIGSILAAQWYDAIRQMSREQVAARLRTAQLPDRETQIQNIKTIFPPVADQIIHDQRAFLDLTQDTFESLKQRIVDRWDDVQAIAANVPPPQQFADWLRQAGAPITGNERGLSEREVDLAKEYSHYLRNRFTINKLRLILGLA